VLKNIFKRGYEEISDRKLLKIWKKNQTWLKYEYMPKRRPHFFSKMQKDHLTFVIQIISVNNRGRATSKYELYLYFALRNIYEKFIFWRLVI
jgi:hypothetical protein